MKNEIALIDMTETKTLKKYKRYFAKIVKEVEKELSLKEKLSLSVTLCDNNYIHELNKQYRNKDMPTDVLSFAIEDGMDKKLLSEINELSKIREVGDIIISLEKVNEQANEYGHSFKREICFLFTHGVLHLLGYDHMKEEEEKVMFGIQEKVLNNLKIVR